MTRAPRLLNIPYQFRNDLIGVVASHQVLIDQFEGEYWLGDSAPRWLGIRPFTRLTWG